MNNKIITLNWQLYSISKKCLHWALNRKIFHFNYISISVIFATHDLKNLLYGKKIFDFYDYTLQFSKLIIKLTHNVDEK